MKQPFEIAGAFNWGIWTNFVPFNIKRMPHYIVYNYTGKAHFDRISEDGASSDTLLETFWASDFVGIYTDIIPYYASGKAHFIGYNKSTGLVHFVRIHDDFNGSDIIYQSTWAKRWILMPFGSIYNHFLAYNSHTGEVHFDRIRDDGAGFDIIWSSYWAPGWTHLMPFIIPDPNSIISKPGFIAYNADTGEVHFDRIRDDWAGSDIVWSNYWALGWTHFMPIGDRPHFFLAYNSNTGEVHLDRIRVSGYGSDMIWSSHWAPGWSNFMPFSIDYVPYFLAYTNKYEIVQIHGKGLAHFIRVDGDFLNGWRKLDNFVIQGQQQTKWCWAAVTASVDAFFNPPSPRLTQCQLANIFKVKWLDNIEQLVQAPYVDCCTNGADPTYCNRGFHTELAFIRHRLRLALYSTLLF